MSKQRDTKPVQRRPAPLTSDRHRLSVHKSDKHIYAQIIDDRHAKTIVAYDDRALPPGKTKVERAHAVGAEIARRAMAKKIATVRFDRAQYRYHGRVRAVAEEARAGGLVF